MGLLIATGDVQGLAADPGGVIGGQERDGSGDIVGLTDPANRRLGYKGLVEVVFRIGNA